MRIRSWTIRLRQRARFEKQVYVFYVLLGAGTEFEFHFVVGRLGRRNREMIMTRRKGSMRISLMRASSLLLIQTDYNPPLEWSMAPTGGWDIGIDHLVIFLTDSTSMNIMLFGYPRQRATDAALRCR